MSGRTPESKGSLFAKYFDGDGCNLCGSQEWNEELTDVDHAPSCAAPMMERMAAMIREMEWAGNQALACCPICEQRPKSGHAPDCRLAALLRELP